ncbi:uncharacterized protein LOC118274008 [Spodoptera frugiperda]|uniref:Uncharacterized protein LOC118274008 n=1 Tax=Spodoptera frugiperda TaxID=7108 RepID=A0A9R0DBP6_SPOFR|nr:uncharacterized protein LOC118274008 [Spodoptera frugiperda]
MWNSKAILLWCGVLIRVVFPMEVPHDLEKQTEVTGESDSVRGRRGVIEEEKYYNMQSHRQDANMNMNQPWIPGPLPPEDPTTKISITNEVKEVLPLYQTTERVTDKPTGRGARASNENWIKLPIPGHDDLQRDQRDQRDQREQRDQRDNILTPPQPSGDLINSRMPRVNFVTQNKALEASESRNDKESVQRSTRTDEIRTEFVRPDEERDRDRNKYKPVFPRQAVYNAPVPEESRRFFYDDRYYPVPDDLYRRDPYYDMIDRRRYYPYYGPRVDRYDEPYDNLVPRKPKRIIYYAHLPEVVRTPPSVDLRYRYSVDPYRRFDDDVYARNGRYDYRFRNRYPYAPLRKDERNYRDLAGAGTVAKDKKVEDKVTPTPILPQKEDKFKTSMNANRNLINSHQYHDSADSYNEPISHKSYPDIVRADTSYFRYDEPLLHGPVDEPYQRKY